MHPLLRTLRERAYPWLPMVKARGVIYEQATSVELRVGPTTRVAVTADREMLDLVVPRAMYTLGWHGAYARRTNDGALTIAFGGQQVIDQARQEWFGAKHVTATPPHTVFDGTLDTGGNHLVDPPHPTHYLVVSVRAGMPLRISIVE